MKVFILGPYNSGTNLLQNIFAYINGHRNEVSHQWGRLPRDKQMHGGGKHTLIDLPDLFDKVVQKNSLYIVCFRNIHSWINSCLKKNYKITIDEADDIKFCNRKWGSLVEVYNEYYTNYMKIIKKYDNVIFIEYSKIIEDKEGFKYLRSKIKPFGLHINKKYFDYCLSVPSHHRGTVGNSKNAQKKEKKVINSINDHTKFVTDVKKEIIEFYQ